MDTFIERAALDPGFDVVKLDALLRMQREAVHETAKREFNAAMAAAQAEMLPVIRDATNTHTGSKYAKLATIDAEMRPIYTKHGFSIRFGTAPAPQSGWIRVMCTVAHAGGYEEPPIALDAPMDVAGSGGKVNKTAIQAVGSSVSYLRRYLLTMAFNIVLADDPDDDGEAVRPTAASGRDRQAARAYPAAEGPPEADPFPTLAEQNGTQWLRNLRILLESAESEAVVVAIGGHARVVAAIRTAPTLIRGQIDDMLREAHTRVARPADADWPDDPIRELLAEIAEMDADALDTLTVSAAWRAKTRDVFPPDMDRLQEAIALRRATLKGEAKHEQA
jgi:hypothetical protein